MKNPFLRFQGLYCTVAECWSTPPTEWIASLPYPGVSIESAFSPLEGAAEPSKLLRDGHGVVADAGVTTTRATPSRSENWRRFEMKHDDGGSRGGRNGEARVNPKKGGVLPRTVRPSHRKHRTTRASVFECGIGLYLELGYPTHLLRGLQAGTSTCGLWLLRP